MAKEILVPLRGDDRIEEIIPYVEKLAQPGMRVVFLSRYLDDGFPWLHVYATTMGTGIRSMVAVKKMVERYSWEQQERLARQRVYPACEALRKRGAQISVDVYTGSLRKVVRSYTRNGDVHLIVMRAGIGLRMKRFLYGTFPIFSLFKRPSFTPMLVVHPGTPL